MRMRDIIVGTVIVVILATTVIWIAISVYQHENVGSATPATLRLAG